MKVFLDEKVSAERSACTSAACDPGFVLIDPDMQPHLLLYSLPAALSVFGGDGRRDGECG